MSAVDAFNALLKDFLTQLSVVFAEHKKLALYAKGFDSLLVLDKHKPMDVFLEALAPHSALLLAKDPSLFDANITLPGNISISKLWATPDLSDNTRAAIWGYLQNLYIVASTYASMPPDLLAAVEGIAQSCAADLKEGEAPNMAQLLPRLTAQLAPVLSATLGGGAGDGGGDLGQAVQSLLGSGALAGLAGGGMGMMGGGGGGGDMAAMLAGLVGGMGGGMGGTGGGGDMAAMLGALTGGGGGGMAAMLGALTAGGGGDAGEGEDTVGEDSEEEAAGLARTLSIGAPRAPTASTLSRRRKYGSKGGSRA